MRCQCCNVILTPYESTMRRVSDNSFLDVCEKCYTFMSDDVKVLTREDLHEEVGIDVANYIDTEGNYDD